MPLTTTSSTSRCLYPSFSANPSLLSGLQRKAPSTPNLGGFQPGAVVTAAAARDSFIFIFYVFFPPFRPQARSRSPRSPRRRPGQAAPSAPLPPPGLGSAQPGPARPRPGCRGGGLAARYLSFGGGRRERAGRYADYKSRHAPPR